MWLLLGWVSWPAVRRIFSKWADQGYLLSKIIGAALVTYIVWIGGWLHLLPFTSAAVWLVLLAVGIACFFLRPKKSSVRWSVWLTEELFFAAALIFWSWIKAHEPTINGLEKFMDFGFTKSLLAGLYFPPRDMWFAGQPINYYYFGHLLLAVVTRLSGLDLGFTFNLMLATIFAFCLTMGFAIARQLLHKLPFPWQIGGAVFTALILTLSGNLHTIYAFTKGYSGDTTPPPFWQIWSDFSSWDSLKAGWNAYWYPDATRFIPYTIHEFPSYSFVVSDVHGHVLAIPLDLLAIALLVNIFWVKKTVGRLDLVLYGLVCGLSFMTNALDGPIYLGLFGLLLLSAYWPSLKRLKIPRELLLHFGLLGAVFIVTVLPFLVNFKPFVSGLAINCPPAALANSKMGPFLFEGVEKCQKSPLWMMLVLWGFFLYNAVRLFLRRDREENVFKIISVVCLGLLIFPEFFYFKDIYPMHFRSNTMFKLGYQVFILMSLVSGYVIVQSLYQARKNLIYLAGLLPLLFLVAIYPSFGVKSYFGDLRVYHGIYGLGWLSERYPGNWDAINWLQQQEPPGSAAVILEANGDSYTDYDQISAFSGLPTVAGWTVHEWLWRGSYQPIADRAEEVRRVYTAADPAAARQVLSKYRVTYIVDGPLEQQKYPGISEKNLAQFGQLVFDSQGTKIFRVSLQ